MHCAPAFVTTSSYNNSFSVPKLLVKETMCFPPTLMVAIAISQQNPTGLNDIRGRSQGGSYFRGSSCSKHNSGSVLGSEKYRHRVSPSEYHQKVNITDITRSEYHSGCRRSEKVPLTESLIAVVQAGPWRC